MASSSAVSSNAVSYGASVDCVTGADVASSLEGVHNRGFHIPRSGKGPGG